MTRALLILLVSFSGLDGAGKGTQIDALSARLTRSGRKPSVLWARGGYTPVFQALKRQLRRLSGRRLLSAGNSRERKKAMGRPWVARLWLWVAISDLILFWGVYLRLLRLFGRVVICDRYIDDTRLDFRRNFPTIDFERMLLWRLLERVTSVPDVAFLLWVPVDESMRRSVEKSEPFPDDEKTLAWRLEAYMDESLFSPERYVRLDCRKSVCQISREITANMEAIFTGRL